MRKLKISLKQLKLFHEEFDKQIGMLKTVCTKGCASCCYQFVPVMSFEVNYIKDAFRDLKPSIKKKVIEQYQIAMNHFLENTSNKPILTFKEVHGSYAQKVGRDWIACPFLVENQCSIYEVRPFTCQMHFQLDDPQKCKENNVRDTDKKAMQIMARFLEFLLLNGDFYLVSILMILKDVVDKKRVVKEIERELYTKNELLKLAKK